MKTRDRSANRSSKKFKAHAGINECWKYYKDKYNKVDEQTYKKVVKDFNKAISDLIITEGFEFRVPLRMGFIYIKKRKIKYHIDRETGKLYKGNLYVDWGETWKLWERDKEANKKGQVVYYNNKHTDGYTYKWHYNKFTANYKNKSAYFFTPCRTNKEKLHKVLNNLQDYPELDYYTN